MRKRIVSRTIHLTTATVACVHPMADTLSTETITLNMNPTDSHFEQAVRKQFRENFADSAFVRIMGYDTKDVTLAMDEQFFIANAHPITKDEQNTAEIAD